MDFDNITRAIAHPHRRKAIRHFADLERDRLPAERLNDELFDGNERTLMQLHHVHLPLLDDAGFITYDHGTKTIRLEELSDNVDRLVAVFDDVYA